MGDAKSHLTIEELLQAVNDPSYNVRYEAIVSMARMPHDNKLLNALMDVIRSREPGLSEAAAWALGRMRDLRALPVLKEMLKCEYALLRSQCARALANMNDQDSIPEIIAAFGNEHNHNIRAGYAAALGKLCRKEALPDILALLRNLKDERLQGEVALAAARIIGGEHHFVDLWRNSRTDYETACVEELVKIRRRLRYAALHLDKFQSILADCAKKFEQRNLTAGTGDLRAMIAEMLPEDLEQPVGKILEECKNTLSEAGTPRRDYILLALNTLHTAVVSLIHNERKKKLLT
jgi:HEAT repeat protein